MTPVRPERPWPRSGARTGRVFEACNGRLPDKDGMEQVLIWSMNFCWQWADGVYWPTFNLIQPVGQDELAARSCHLPSVLWAIVRATSTGIAMRAIALCVIWCQFFLTGLITPNIKTIYLLIWGEYLSECFYEKRRHWTSPCAAV